MNIASFNTRGGRPRLISGVVRSVIVAGLFAAFSPVHGQTLSVDSSLGNSPFTLGSVGTYTSIQVGTSSGGTGVVNNVGPVNGTPAVTLGLGSSSTGTWNMSSGATLNLGRLLLGPTGSLSSGIFNQNGGSVTIPTWSAGGNTFHLGAYNLNGGDLTSSAPTSAGPTANCPFYFNGGTLHAGVDSSAFFAAGPSTVTQVRDGGAFVDTAGFAITFPQTLAHSTVAGDNAIDGGLTKQGEGTLTLSHANTFTGNVAISGGTLLVTSDPALGSGTTVTISGDGQLNYQLAASSTVTRSFNLGISSLAVSGGTLTISGGTINAGFLTSPIAAGANGLTINGSIFYGSASLTSNGGPANLTNVTNNGAAITVSTSQVLNWNGGTSSGGTDAKPALKVDGTANVQNWTSTGVVMIDNQGTLSNTLSSLILSGGSRTTINSGGTLTSVPSIELNGALLVNNGTQTGTLNVNYGSTVQGVGAFGSVNVTDLGTLSSAGTINGALSVAANGVVTLNGPGTLTVNGAITNNGVMRFERQSNLALGDGFVFTNNGTLDIISGSFSTPADGFVNNGIVLDSRLVTVKDFSHANGGPVTVAIDAYPGHTYTLLRGDTLATTFGTIPGVPPQTNPASNVAAITATFSDPSPAMGEGFYRVAVDL